MNSNPLPLWGELVNAAKRPGGVAECNEAGRGVRLNKGPLFRPSRSAMSTFPHERGRQKDKLLPTNRLAQIPLLRQVNLLLPFAR